MTTSIQNESESILYAADGITAVKFGRKSDHLIVSSWDSSIKLYNKSDQIDSVFSKAGVLDCEFLDEDNKIAYVGLDKTLHVYDFNSRKNDDFETSHTEPIRKVLYHGEKGLLITGGWDAAVKLWDPRVSDRKEVGSYKQFSKIYAMSHTDSRLVVGTKPSDVRVYDLRNLSVAEEEKDSIMKYQIRDIQCFPNGKGYVVSSIEGRLAVEYFSSGSDGESPQGYAFKAHRKESPEGQTLIYPINAIAFNKKYETFATGGSDGIVNVWDASRRKKIWKSRMFHTSVSALSFNKECDKMAIAVSYMFEEGPKDPVPDNIVIMKDVSETELKFKDKTSAA
eukprot:CAMPEP_0114979524 /NCGR_PEP_ID=MMETSP0216-20121206/4418_1 /TAXON_ID=223996 /ORGANISM="Protocruzia adherens, Strain Boccale" /LENGTH=336 /DNA_ID=CAMNT_0002340857 /DNA_START=30 /DNA_END=1040 /DNA_ORIENTATION=+